MAATPERPHILLITTDQQRHDCLGVNGNTVLRTPNLDALAARGVNFTRAYTTCPVCIPARRTLLSGQHPRTHGLTGYRDGLEWDCDATLPGQLARAGYQTQLVGKMHLHPQGKRYGFDNIILSETMNWRPTCATQRRNDYVSWLREHGHTFHPNAHGISGNGRLVHPWPHSEELHHTSWLAEEAVRFLTETRDPAAPFFLHLSFTHPHPPLVPPTFYLDRYMRHADLAPTIGAWAPSEPARPGVDPNAAAGPYRADEIHEAIAAYYALINHIDDRIAFVLERWMEYGNPRAREPLLILFTSDHGEMLGDHHLFRKSLPYEASAHVPFFLTGFNMDLQPGACDALVSLEDVLPTLCAGGGADIPAGIDGVDLSPALRGEPVAGHERLHIECRGSGDHHAIVEGDWKYVRFMGHGEEQLFNLREDPNECHDRSGDADLEPWRASFRAWAAARDFDTGPDPAPCRNAPPLQLFA